MYEGWKTGNKIEDAKEHFICYLPTSLVIILSKKQKAVECLKNLENIYVDNFVNMGIHD